MSETEQARTRRRWINLGEIVGIGALVVSVLSYWDTHQERKATAALAPVAAHPAPLVLTGAVEHNGERIILKPATAEHVIETQTIRFPSAVKPDPVETTGNSRIEAAWFDAGLRAALKDAKLHAGRHRLPIVVETTYVTGSATATDRALYDLGYSLHTRLLRPDMVTLEGISLVRRGGSDLQAAADARFAQGLPKPE